MILVDTSVWADHFRSEIGKLSSLIAREEILQHPFVTGELALGNPRDRKGMVAMLESLDEATVCTTSEFHTFVEANDLGGTGVGFVDAHLLASAAGSKGALLWTHDKRLADQAERLGLNYTP